MSPGPRAKAPPGWRIASGQCRADPGGYPAVSAPPPSAPLGPRGFPPSPPADPCAQAPGLRLRSRHAGPSPWSPRPSDPSVPPRAPAPAAVLTRTWMRRGGRAQPQGRAGPGWAVRRWASPPVSRLSFFGCRTPDPRPNPAALCPHKRPGPPDAAAASAPLSCLRPARHGTAPRPREGARREGSALQGTSGLEGSALAGRGGWASRQRLRSPEGERYRRGGGKAGGET